MASTGSDSRDEEAVCYPEPYTQMPQRHQTSKPGQLDQSQIEKFFHEVKFILLLHFVSRIGLSRPAVCII